MNISIKQCSIQDLDVLRAFSIKTYYQTFARHNPPEIMTAYLQDAFNEKKLCAELGNPNSTFYFLYQGEEIVGYLKVNETPAQTDINDKESLEIERFYLSSDFQGKGYGQLLMEQAINIAIERGKKYVWLGVWEHNERAKKFYAKNGFYKIGQHSFFMGDDEQTDYIMRRNLD